MTHAVSRWIGVFVGALALAAVARAAEFTTENNGGPKVTHVKLMHHPDLREYWAWVTLEHEDWPIETRRFLLPDEKLYPDISSESMRGDSVDWRQLVRPDDIDRVDARSRSFPAPYRHAVDWWSVLGPKGEKIARRDIEYPHPGGWPFTLLQRGIKVPFGITQLTFKAHDPIHGYGPVQVTVDLLKKSGPGFEVEESPMWKWTGRRPSAKKYFRSVLGDDVFELW